MRQRVAFVRTLLAGRPVLALDEPFASLDALTRSEMQAWLAGALAREPRTVAARHPRRRGGGRARATASSVLSPRPGRIVRELSIALPRPRRRTDPEVVALREQALEALRPCAH